MNKIKEIKDEPQENSVKDEPLSDLVTETREDGLKEEKMNTSTDNVMHTDLQDHHGEEDTSTKHRKSKKHKKQKSKKKRKKRKEEKDSSSDTESDKEIQESGKKKKRKKKKKSKDADKVKRSGSRSESSSASGSESESELKPSNENTKSSSADKTSKSELRNTSGVGKPQELPDIIPKMENSGHKSTEKLRTKEKKISSSRTSKSKESSRGRQTRSKSPRLKSEHRSRSPKQKRQSKSTSRNSSSKRSHQQRERSRSRSKRHNNRSRSHSVRRGKHSRSRSRSRQTRSRSVVISRKNRRSTSKSRSRSPRHRCHSRSKSQSRTNPSKSRSISKSRSDLKLETELIEKDIDPAVDNSKSCETQTNASQNTTENEQDPTVTVKSDTTLSETASIISNSGFNAVGVRGSWRPVPFLAEPSETTSSQKCITPEVTLEVTNVSEEPSTFSTVKPKDSEDAASPEKKETNENPTTSEETSVEKNSMSPSRSLSQKRSKVAARSRSKSSSKKRKSRSSSRKSRSPSERKTHKSRTSSKRSKSRSPEKRLRSRKRSHSRSRRRSRSGSRRRRGLGSQTLNQRDRWKREPSRSPVLILRKKSLASRTRHSTSKTPPRLTELDKDQLLEIAKANAAAMCTKAGVPIPESLRPKAFLQLPLPTLNSTFLSLYLPMMSNMTMNAAMASMTAATMTAALSSMGALSSLPQMAPLPTILNKPPSTTTQNLASIEEAKKKVTKQTNSFNIKELTERCKKITENKEEMAIAKPHVSDDEEDERLFGASLKENKGITFSLSNTSIKPSVRTEATFAKEFLVFPGSQHKNKEADGGYGEWLPVKKKTVKPSASGSSRTVDIYSVFPKAPSRPVDITLAVSERAVAQKKLAENSSDINAMCILNRAQEQVDALAQSNTIPGLCTGSAGAQVLSSDELSNSGPQAWIKKVKP